MRILIAAAFAAMFAAPAHAVTCYVNEYSEQGRELGRAAVVPIAGIVAVEQTAFGHASNSTQSAAFGASTAFIRIICDDKTHFTFGLNPTATTGKPYLAPDTAEYFAVVAGQKIAVIDGVP